MSADQTTIWPVGWSPESIHLMSQQAPKGTWQEVDQELLVYRRRLKEARANNEFLDTHLGELLIETGRTVLRDAPTLDKAQQVWLRMAIGYLVCKKDGNDDFQAIDGLDDDAIILIGFLEAIGRPDLAQAIRKHLR